MGHYGCNEDGDKEPTVNSECTVTQLVKEARGKKLAATTAELLFYSSLIESVRCMCSNHV